MMLPLVSYQQPFWKHAFIWKAEWQRKAEAEGSLPSPAFTHQMTAITGAQPGWKQEPTWVAHMKGRDPTIWAIFWCLPRCLSYIGSKAVGIWNDVPIWDTRDQNGSLWVLCHKLRSSWIYCLDRLENQFTNTWIHSILPLWNLTMIVKDINWSCSVYNRKNRICEVKQRCM